MPVTRCQKNGKSGWKWGQQGVCYLGPGGKKKAARQGLAAVANGYPISGEERAKLMAIVKKGK